MVSTPGFLPREEKDRRLNDLKAKTLKVGFTTDIPTEDETYATLEKSSQVPEQTVTFGPIAGTSIRTILNDIEFSQASTGAGDVLYGYYIYYNDGTDKLVAVGRLHDSEGEDCSKTIDNIGDIIKIAVGDIDINVG